MAGRPCATTPPSLPDGALRARVVPCSGADRLLTVSRRSHGCQMAVAMVSTNMPAARAMRMMPSHQLVRGE